MLAREPSGLGGGCTDPQARVAALQGSEGLEPVLSPLRFRQSNQARHHEISLGHVIQCEGVAVDQSKIVAIVDWPDRGRLAHCGY